MKIATGGEGWGFTEEQWLLRQNVRELVEKEIAPHFKDCYTEETADPFYRKAMKLLGDAGFLRVGVPERLGGLGMGLTSCLIVTEEVARGNGALAIHAMENQLLGAQFAIFTPKAWEDWGEKLMSGEAIYAGAMTAPEGNSNFPGWPKNFGRLEGDEWVLNGEKAFSSGGTFADVIVAKAMCEGELHFFVVPVGTPGLTVHHNPEFGNSPTSASTTYKNVRIPKGYGGPMTVSVDLLSEDLLGFGRKEFGLGCAALAVGAMTAAYDETVAYMSQRESCGKKVLEYGAIQAKLVDMKTKMEAARSLMYTAAHMCEAMHKDSPAFANMAKISCCETANWLTEQCVPMFGCMGVHPDTGIMRHHLDAIGVSIGVGTSDILIPSIASSLGFPTSDDLCRF